MNFSCEMFNSPSFYFLRITFSQRRHLRSIYFRDVVGRAISNMLATIAAGPRAHKPTTMLARGNFRSLKITYTVIAIKAYRNNTLKYAPMGTRGRGRPA